ncbi:MAG: hypothetical protein QM770_03465 [Tepidisphaeraceae bacterium]
MITAPASRRRFTRTLSRVALVASSALLASSAARAQAPAGNEAVAGGIILAPIDRLDKTLNDAGYAGAGDQIAQMAAGALRMFQPTDLDRTLPAGVQMLVGPNIGEQQQAIIAIPLVAGSMSLDKLGANAQAVAGHDDMKLMNGFPFRRTGHYLMFGGTSTAVGNIKEEELIGMGQDESLIFMGMADLATIKRVAPEKWQEFLNSVEKENGAPAANAAEEAGRKEGQRWVKEFVGSLDNAGMSLKRQGDTLVTDLSFSPSGLDGTPSTVSKCELPEGGFARIDYAYPSEKARDTVSKLFDAIGQAASKDGKVTPEQIRPVFDAMADIAVGEAASATVVGQVDGSCRVYAVVQRSAAKPIEQQLDALDAAANKANEGTPEKLPWKRSTYSADNLSVSRLTMEDKGKTVYMDLANRGNDLIVTISYDDGQHLGELASLGTMTEKYTAIVDVNADLAKTFAFMKQLSPANEQAELEKAAAILGEGEMHFTLLADQGGTGTVRQSMPLKVIGNVLKMATGQQ